MLGIFFHKKRSLKRGLPYWLSDKESTCQCRRRGFDPLSRKIPHAAEQLSPYATTIGPVVQSLGTITTEPTCPRACAPQQEKPPQEKPVHTYRVAPAGSN